MTDDIPVRKIRKKTKNVFSFLMFGWLNEMFARGYKGGLKESDLLDLERGEDSRNISSKLERHWKTELHEAKCNGKRPSLLKAICRTFGPQYCLCGVLVIMKEAIVIANPFLLIEFLKFFENRSTSSEGYMFATAMTLGATAFGLLHEWYFYYTSKIGWHLRTAVCALMYKKAIRLDQQSLASATTGHIISLGSTDVIRFDYAPLFVNHIWVAPLFTLVIAILIWQVFGVPSLLAVGMVLLNMALSTVLGRFHGKIRFSTSLRTDRRVRVINEILTAMRVVKMFAWEKPYKKLVRNLRRKEIGQILHSAYLRAFSYAMIFVTNKCAILGTLILYVTFGGHLTPSKVFSFVVWVNATQIPAGMLFTWAVDYGSEAVVSIRRIESFLLLDEIPETATDCRHNVEEQDTTTSSSNEAKIVFERFTAAWNNSNPSYMHEKAEARTVTLKNIDESINGNMLLAVIGPVGSGKSSLLSAILHELPAKFGDVTVTGRVAFVSQTPWVFSSTVRDNILFGSECEPERLTKVVDVCAMREDVNSFNDGVDTVVGERGVTLSGGQKARVSLARAAYRENTDIILMDEPLSAVDAKVAKHIFQQCICGYMASKLRVLVTHQLPFLKAADRILVLKEGEICQSGTYDQLVADGTDFAAVLRRDENHRRKPAKTFVGDENYFCDVSFAGKLDTANQINTVVAVEEEAKEIGSISWKAFVEYMVNNKILFLLLVLLAFLNSTLFVLLDWWIAVWTTDSDNFEPFSGSYDNATSVETFSSSTSPPVATFNNAYYMCIAAYLLFGFAVTMFAQCVLLVRHLVVSGLRIHDKMLEAILRSPIRFFDINPIGRVLNRFSKDMGQVDEVLPRHCRTFVYDAGILFSILVLSSAVNYFVLLPTLPLFLYFVWIRRYYVVTSRDIKRYEGKNKSPVFSHLKSTLDGLTTVRAYGMQSEFESRFHHLQDCHSCAWSAFVSASRWLAVRLDLIGAAYVGAVTFLAVITVSQTHLNAGQVGLTVTYLLQMLARLQWSVLVSTEIENQMTSVERIRQYCKLPPESPLHIPESDSKIPTGWPTQGRIELNRVNFAHFKGGPDVLHDICASILAHEKIGVVGRTGAGKSSLIACLFRFNELTSGSLQIDGVDVSKIGLNALRSAISAIPQDPILFAGSLRYNLDPFGSYSDDEIWGVLEKVQMKKEIERHSMKLEMELTESGTNFSVGERQLLCLARAILRRHKILLVDEATANVDIRTDQLIQKTIKETFKNCTVITVAHRIDTIVDCDRVMVLQRGRLVEFDEPHALLQRDSLFSRMIEAVGTFESQVLRDAAEKAHLRRKL